MRSQWLKYLLVGFLLVTFINRAFLVSAPEAEPVGMAVAGEGRGEINSLAEFVGWLINGEENGVDEDGDLPESYHFAQLIQPVIGENLFCSIELPQPVTCTRDIYIPLNQSIGASPIYGTVEQPPEKV